MEKKKKAVGYVCDIPVAGEEITISREYQRTKIEKYAREHDIDLVAVYEDSEYTDDFVGRPGVKAVLGCCGEVDEVLVERVWCMSRKMKDLKPFMEAVCTKGARLVAASYLWDCVSQQVRHAGLAESMSRARAEAKKIREAA